VGGKDADGRVKPGKAIAERKSCRNCLKGCSRIDGCGKKVAAFPAHITAKAANAKGCGGLTWLAVKLTLLRSIRGPTMTVTFSGGTR
jgi:hypothetical protein